MAKTFVKLDRRELRKLQAGDKVTEHGIAFERLASGDGIYSVAVMVDGVRIHRVIGRESDGTTRTQAEEFIEKVRTDARHDRLTLPKGRKIALSFKDAAGKYMLKLKESGGKNLDVKQRHIDQHLVPFFGVTPLSKISTFDVERYKKHRLSEVAQKGGDRRSLTADRRTAIADARRSAEKSADRTEGKKTAPGTVNRELATLSHLFGLAGEWGWITSAKPRMKRMKEGDGRIVYLTAEQAQRFLAAAADSDNAQLYPFVLIALETSMRKSEVLSIARANVDVQRRLIYIPQAKGGARDQPITERLAMFLDKYMKESIRSTDAWLFPSASSKSGHTIAIEKPFRKAAAAAGLDPTQVVRHTLRHTAVSHLVQSGVDLPTVKRISGHKTLQMVERYAHQNGEHIQAAMDKLQERYAPSKVA